MAQKINAASIQKHLEVKEIKDDVVVLKSGGLRALLMTTSLNFALKSADEQDAIIARYQDFINSLDFPLQVVAISRKFNIGPYIKTLEEQQLKQENELLKIQTAEYIDFVKGLTEMTNIMTESFYLVIPFAPGTTAAIKKAGFLNKILGSFKKGKEQPEAKKQSFQEQKHSLWQRLEFVTTGLRRMGIKAAPLKTDELIELFYKLYNPSAKEEPEIKKAKEMRIQ